MPEEITDEQLLAKALDLFSLLVEGSSESLPQASLSTVVIQLTNRLKDVPEAYKTRPQLRIIIGMQGIVEPHELQATDIALSLTASGHVNVYKNRWGVRGYKTVEDVVAMIRDTVNKRVKAQPEDSEETSEE